jgi:hypothetical protein
MIINGIGGIFAIKLWGLNAATICTKISDLG